MNRAGFLNAMMREAPTAISQWIEVEVEVDLFGEAETTADDLQLQRDVEELELVEVLQLRVADLCHQLFVLAEGSNLIAEG